MADGFTITKAQAEFLMSLFNIDDPNEAIDLLIQMMFIEGVDPMDTKLYIMKLMEKELENANR